MKTRRSRRKKGKKILKSSLSTYRKSASWRIAWSVYPLYLVWGNPPRHRYWGRHLTYEPTRLDKILNLGGNTKLKRSRQTFVLGFILCSRRYLECHTVCHSIAHFQWSLFPLHCCCCWSLLLMPSAFRLVSVCAFCGPVCKLPHNGSTVDVLHSYSKFESYALLLVGDWQHCGVRER